MYSVITNQLLHHPPQSTVVSDFILLTSEKVLVSDISTINFATINKSIILILIIILIILILLP